MIGKIYILIAFVFAAATAQSASRPPASETASVDSIMALVARNQDRAQELRQAYVYNQSLVLRFRRGNGKVAREETREYAVLPTENGISKELTRFAGSYEKDGRMIPYSEPGFTYKDSDIDGELIDGLADGLVNDRKSRDGIAAELFPLTTKEQRKYHFEVKKTEEYRGQLVHQITFKPAKKSWDENDGTPWAGEILVDAAECQPVLITTRLAKGIPVAARVLLGTNLKGLGFKLSYKKFEDGVWFPVSYGAEFELKAVFFYKRRIAIALSNDGFKRSVVAANVTFEPPPQTDGTRNEPEIR
jgi:hypothetical protein